MTALVTLEEARAQLNRAASASATDAEILRVIEAVTAPIERIAGAVLPTPHTEVYAGGGRAIVLAHAPVLTVTSVGLAVGGELAADGWRLDRTSGVLTRLAAGSPSIWEPGQLTISYVAGLPSIPPHVRMAALITVQHLWELQRGSRDQRFTGSSDQAWTPAMGFALPHRAMELLGEQTAGIA
ncbi:hypothetical protein ACIBG7_43230 [Nonomuraea sp. NPDC050328]|uniref:hypothetical protein n=1 Tax=Nonomuraea sp. NPDC050328 TaxID=3364361 RepID=UPI0037A80007